MEGTAQEKARKLEKIWNSVPTLDVQIQQWESFIMRPERRLAEIDAQRVAEQESLTEARAMLERLRSEAVQCADRQESGSRAALQQMVNLLQWLRDALAKELQVMCATEEDVCPVAKKQAVARWASHPLDAEARAKRRDELVAGSSGRAAQCSHNGRLASRHGVVPSDVGRCEASDRNISV